MIRRATKELKTNLRKALTVSGGEVTPLIPEDLEPAIREYLFYMSPLSQMVQSVEANGLTHEVVRRTALNRGWFEGEKAGITYGNSSYGRKQVEVKILRTHGKVTDFAISVARSFTDAWAGEIEGATLAFADLFEYQTMWSLSDEFDALTGDAYQSPGVYGWLIDDAIASNIFDAKSGDAAGDTITLDMLDDLYGATIGKYRNFRRDPYVWLMSQDMIDKVSGLQSRVTRETTTVEYEGDFTMVTYKGIPILPSGFCAPEGTATPASIAAAKVAGGSLADDEYFYRVAAITLYGEQVAAGEQSATTSVSDNSVKLTWTAGGDAKLYAIYKGTTTGDNNLSLLDIIPAKTYDANGKVTGDVEEYTDDGSQSLLSGEIRPLDSGEETVWLVNLGTNYGVSRPVLTPEEGTPLGALLRYEDVPVATDELAFRLKSYCTLQVPNGKSMAMLRRAKAS